MCSSDLPAAPGRYRLIITIHDPEGVAFDAATQGLLRTLSVRVSARLSVAYAVAPTLAVSAGSTVDLPIRLANDGAEQWAYPEVEGDDCTFPLLRCYRPPQLVARWVALGSPDASVPDVATASVARLQPRQQATTTLQLTAPEQPGSYLLLVDLNSPIHGSLAASGVPAAQVTVTVLAPEVQTPEVDPTP